MPPARAGGMALLRDSVGLLWPPPGSAATALSGDSTCNPSLASSIAVQERSQLQGAAERERGLLGVACVADCAQDAHALRAGVEHGHDVLTVDPADRKEGDLGVGRGVADELGADRRAAQLGWGCVHRADADVVNVWLTVGC